MNKFDFSIIFFEKILDKFKKISFIINKDIDIDNYCHVNYISHKIVDNIKYTFNGFFKDNYFVIMIDSRDEKLDINIEHKEVIIVEVDWVLKNVNENNYLWILNIEGTICSRKKSYILPIRKSFFTNFGVNIGDYLKINDAKIKNCIFYRNPINNLKPKDLVSLISNEENEI